MSSQAIGQRFRVSRGGCWQCVPDCRSRLSRGAEVSQVAYNGEGLTYLASQTQEQRTNMEHEQDKSNEEHGQLRQAGVSRSFSDVLRSFGFRRCKSYAKGITCFISACGHRYAEVYTETWGKWAWATGDGLPQDPGYPGGKAYHEPHRLHEVLSSCG